MPRIGGQLMDAVVLDDIPFKLDFAALLKRLHVPEQSEHAAELRQLADEAEAVGRPRAMYKEVPIESKGDQEVVIEGVRLTSHVLRVNLDQAYKAFPFVATCGVELDSWSPAVEGVLQAYWVDQLRELALRAAINHMRQILTEQHGLVHASMMNPGSLPDWPLKEQRALFAILGDPGAAIGVQLTRSLLMVPMKSASGLLFPSQDSYENCMLCTRENCPGRRAPYDPDLYDRKYRAAAEMFS